MGNEDTEDLVVNAENEDQEGTLLNLDDLVKTVLRDLVVLVD